jgi:hypothetical protein
VASSFKRRLLWILLAVSAAAGASVWVTIYYIRKPIILKGAVIESNDDPARQSPIADMEVSAMDDLTPAPSRSDFLGYFSVTLQPWVQKGQSYTLHFEHGGYLPLDVSGKVSDDLIILHMDPVPAVEKPVEDHPPVTIGNVVVRYSTETTNANNIGSGVKVFQVMNTGNVPCNHAPVCSPDGKWQAARGEAMLDAGTGNEFRDARVSCIAGPCPFTKIDSDAFSAGGRMISVTVRDWSDSTTFVLQAEVFRVQIGDMVRRYYPTIIGRTLNFSLPAGASGLTLEAEINGTQVEFALGPKAMLSWADCKVSQNRDGVAAYRCELKPWCSFQ